VNTLGKWLARAGGFLIVVGFLMPFFSYKGLGVSLSNLAELPLNVLKTMYFVPLGGLIVLVFSSIPAKNRGQATLFLVGQLGGLILAVLPVLGLLGYIFSKASEASGWLGVDVDFTEFFKVLGFGFFGLLVAYGLTVVSLAIQLPEISRTGVGAGYGAEYKQSVGSYATPGYGNPVGYEAPVAGYGPPTVPGNQMGAQAYGSYLEITGGNLPPSKVTLSDNFTIGRSSQNSLQIPDTRVSRQHARIRYAQGAWFIQDQGSAAGTSVNGQPVQASRLNPGDQIIIGSTTLVFWM
jgi:hypothetical protein